MIINAAVGFFLKCFLVVRPLFTTYYHLRHLIFDNHSRYLDVVPTCQNDYFCSTIDTIGRNFLLVNLTIPIIFFYKFDMRFKDCLNKLVEILKKKIKQNDKN